MKKIMLSTLLIFAASLQGFSQKPWFGFQGGIGLSNMAGRGNAAKLPSQLLPGFTTGFLVDWSVSKYISIQPAIDVIEKGGVRKGSFSKQKFETSLAYLEIPSNVIFYSEPERRGFFAGAGITLGFGVSGDRTVDDPIYMGWLFTEVEELKFGYGEDDDLKTVDVGANLIMGYSFRRGSFFSLTGNLGINNLSNISGSTIRNNYIAFRFGWIIRRKT